MAGISKYPLIVPEDVVFTLTVCFFSSNTSHFNSCPDSYFSQNSILSYFSQIYIKTNRRRNKLQWVEWSVKDKKILPPELISRMAGFYSLTIDYPFCVVCHSPRKRSKRICFIRRIHSNDMLELVPRRGVLV